MLNHLSTEVKRSKYRILGLVGQGQFGRVFCAVHRQTGRLVAIKELDHQRFPTHKFLRELRFLLSLQHRNIVTFHALEHTRKGRYMVMDYCEGGTLRSLMELECHLSFPQNVQIVMDILAGLDHAHSRGIIHCDIKPENILLSVQPDGWTARVSDFGIAKLVQDLGHEDASNTGSPAYMAPERFYGQYSHTSDIYSVGILLFELMTGFRPFSGTPIELMSAHLNCPLKLPDSIPDCYRPIVKTALQKLSARRYRTAGEMLAALRLATQHAEEVIQLSSTLGKPLLQSQAATVVCEVQCQPMERLLAIANHVTVADSLSQLQQAFEPTHLGQGLYIASSKSVEFWPWLQENWPPVNRSHPWMAELPYAIQDLILRPQGCLAITESGIFSLTKNEAAHSLVAQPLVEMGQLASVTVEPRGRWAALLTHMPEHRVLSIQELTHSQASVWVQYQSIHLPHLDAAIAHPQVIALNSRHLAIVFQVVSGSYGELMTCIEVYSRRGTRVGKLRLPIRPQGFQPTANPYQLMALDETHPQHLFLLDIKPYRLMRIGLPFAPDWLVSTGWGYVLANRKGQITILDEVGRGVGQFDVAETITAIASFDSYGLVVATATTQEARLYTIDLRTLNLDFLF